MTSPRTRLRLVERLREQGIRNEAVLAAIAEVPRHIFVDEALSSRAYEDTALPIGLGQTLSQPYIVARMTEIIVDSGPVDRVLEVGTGSGYQAIILAQLCRRLYTIERHPELLKLAEMRFDQMQLANITAIVGDGAGGWPEQAPFERILVAAAAADVPPVLFDQLAIGGIMVVPVGLDEGDQRLMKVTRTSDGADTRDLGPTRFVPLVDGLVTASS